MKYKIGDVVRIKEDLVEGESMVNVMLIKIC